MKKRALHLLVLSLCFAGWSCKELIDFPLYQGTIYQERETQGVFILCEGLFAQNSSTLAFFNFQTQEFVRDIFQSKNGRRLGDTANDMQRHGGSLYIVVDNSGTIEVLDFFTGISRGRIEIRDENGRNRQPRRIAFHEDKAYVICFDSSLLRLDTATLEIEAIITVGLFPDGITVANNRIFVSNSGDRNAGGAGSSVSVVDIETFTLIEEISVAKNPFTILPDSEGDIYVVSRGCYTGNGPFVFQRICSRTNRLMQTFADVPAMNFTIHNDTAFIYAFNFVTQESKVMTFCCRTETIIQTNFIQDGTEIQTPYAIAVNPINGDVYIADAAGFTTTGDILVFNRNGKLRFRIRDVGLNPNSIVFGGSISGGEIPQERVTNHISRVLEFRPAPGQFIGNRVYLPPGRTPENVTYEEVLARINTILTARNQVTAVSLGGWGGYITLGFDEGIRNVRGVFDFRVHGNAMPGSSEPGIVLVSKDVNGNGIADDEWFELAGSEFFNSETIREYEITYFRPNPIGADIRWVDNQGNEGWIYRNNRNTQSSYFPLWESGDKLVFRGTRLPNNARREGTNYVLDAFAFGYADNQPNNSDRSKFDISWAVDSEGNSVELDKIHFIRIYTAINQQNGWLGETSTEVAGVEILNR